VLVGFAGAAAAAGFLLHGRRRGARRLLAAAGAGAAVAGLAGASAIWFCLRNRSLYGSLTGAAYNQALFRLVPQDHALALLTSPRYALQLYDGLWVWTRFALPRPPALAALVAVPRVIGLLALAGLAAVATRRLRGRGGSGGLLPSPPANRVAGERTPRPPVDGRVGRGAEGLEPGSPGAPSTRWPAVVAWALAGAWPVAVFAMVATYDGNGGHTHPRYLFPGLAVLAVAAALGLEGLPGARLGLWTAAVTLAQLALTGAAWAGFVTAWRSRRPSDPADLLGAVAGMLDAGGVHPPWLLLGLAGAALPAALALLALALGRLRVDRTPAAPAGAGGPGEKPAPAPAPGDPQPPAAAPRVSSPA
jgi:hypothetical protein